MRIGCHLVAVLALLVCCSWLCAAEVNELSKQPTKDPAPKLFRILNFENFKKLFGKHYKSVVEEISRMRLFLAECFKSFLSVVRYKQGQETSYDSINYMSDWTDAEFQRTLMKGERLRELKEGRKSQKSPANQIEDESVESEADRVAAGIHNEEDVRRKMIEATQNLNLAQPDKSLSELKGAAVRRRRKRDVDVVTRQDLDAADLMGGLMAQLDRFQHPEIEEGPKRIIRRRTGGDRLALMRDGESDDAGVVTRLMAKNKKLDGLWVDHRNCLPDPAFQGDCGSCYVFATIAALEHRYCMSTGKLTKFSEQFALDCGDERGCEGGWVGAVIDFSVANGLQRHQSWPYLDRRNQCPLGEDPSTSSYWHVTGLEKRTLEVDQFEEEIVNGPITASIHISSGFKRYGGGVDQARGCRKSGKVHCMLIVGHGRENGHDFWLMRNSYGSHWGQDGHYKISKAALARCFVQDPDDNGWLIEGNIKFKKNRKYDQKSIDKLTKQWREELDRKAVEDEEDDESSST